MLHDFYTHLADSIQTNYLEQLQSHLNYFSETALTTCNTNNRLPQENAHRLNRSFCPKPA